MINLAYADTPTNAVNINAWDAILAASPVVQLTLVLLVVMSIVSWAIAINKRKEFRRVEAENDRFLETFWEAKSFEEVSRDLRKFKDTPMAEIFDAGYKELIKLVEKKGGDGKPKFSIHELDNIQRVLRNASERELVQLESKMSFLATTGSTSPFIGLFGTVWGIMGAFGKIAATGSANLAVVAPGISEALVATAIGLAVAIPAVVFFNHYNSKLGEVEMELSQFQSDYLNIIRRNFVLD